MKDLKLIGLAKKELLNVRGGESGGGESCTSDSCSCPCGGPGSDTIYQQTYSNQHSLSTGMNATTKAINNSPNPPQG